jgi:hypothetical protein
MLIIYLHTKFHIHRSNSIFVVSVKVKDKWEFLHGHHVAVLHATQKLP